MRRAGTKWTMTFIPAIRPDRDIIGKQKNPRRRRLTVKSEDGEEPSSTNEWEHYYHLHDEPKTIVENQWESNDFQGRSQN